MYKNLLNTHKLIIILTLRLRKSIPNVKELSFTANLIVIIFIIQQCQTNPISFLSLFSTYSTLEFLCRVLSWVWLLFGAFLLSFLCNFYVCPLGFLPLACFCSLLAVKGLGVCSHRRPILTIEMWCSSPCGYTVLAFSYFCSFLFLFLWSGRTPLVVLILKFVPNGFLRKVLMRLPYCRFGLFPPLKKTYSNFYIYEL